MACFWSSRQSKASSKLAHAELNRYFKATYAPRVEEKDKKDVGDQLLFAAFPIQEVKLVMVVREDLKMTKGKIGAQCGHGTLGAVEQAEKMGKTSSYWRKVVNNWSWEGQKKVCLKVMSEQEL